MTYDVIGDSSDRVQWLAARQLGIGASEMAGVMGASHYESALAVYARKIGALTEDEEQQTEAQYWGSRLEKIVAEEFSVRTQIPHAWHGLLLRSKKHPWALATLDAVAENEPLECKTANQFLLKDWAEGAPLAYVIQAHQQMLVTGAARCRIACLVGGQRFVWDLVERNETMIRKIIHHGEEFTQRVKDRNEPDPDGSDSSFEALEALHRDRSGVVQLPGELIGLDEERDVLKGRLKVAKKRVDEIDSLIQARIGDAQRGVLANGVTYTLATIKRAAYSCNATEYTQLRRTSAR